MAQTVNKVNIIHHATRSCCCCCCSSFSPLFFCVLFLESLLLVNWALNYAENSSKKEKKGVVKKKGYFRTTAVHGVVVVGCFYNKARRCIH